MTQSSDMQTTDAGTPEGDAADVVELGSLTELLATSAQADSEASDSETKTPEGDEGEAGGNAEKNATPKMFNDLAEALSIELDDLYQLQVTTTDGEQKTVEELKALAVAQDEFVVRELEFEEQRVKSESAIRQAQTELAEVIQSLPDGTINAKVLEKIRAKNATRIETEQRKTLQSIPEWQDEKHREADLKGMAGHLQQFGFPADFIGQLVDHRMIAFVRESFLREKRINDALKKVRAGKPNPTTSTKSTGRAPKKGATKKADPNARNKMEAFFSEV